MIHNMNICVPAAKICFYGSDYFSPQYFIQSVYVALTCGDFGKAKQVKPGLFL